MRLKSANFHANFQISLSSFSHTIQILLVYLNFSKIIKEKHVAV